MSERSLCVVTGTRADYGHLSCLMRAIQNDPELRLQVVATGMHLSPEFGMTVDGIIEDGFEVSARVEMLLSSDTAVGIGKSIGLGVIGFAEVFDRLQPDVTILLGDRFEMLAAAMAATAARIPIAHLHGGETTEGAMDEAFRHAITKMSHVHFVAAEAYQCRVRQMGEGPSRIFNFGAPGLDLLKTMERPTRADLEARLGLSLGERNFLVTYHPETLNREGPEKAIQALFEALDVFPDARIIFTKPNCDEGGRKIIELIDAFVEARQERAVAHVSLGSYYYFGVMNEVDAVIGNSSSGLIEAPVFEKPTVNIGDRQKGRLRAGSVVDCDETKASIEAAIRQVLSVDFQMKLKGVKSPYYQGGASEKILAVLKSFDLQNIKKTFYDLPSR
ncbi:MAG: UDP-N-acetylglucosamine 2-epimerase (hydrolyzing) [Candidatus Nitrohelix vancouverensis]|uniref:UDP-N-acetylglucosamine 2-epimerase (Hydrolyzing) n=1 Tax=Candidatus Nitrohelix vancouverensis TaxID=2705534 RepID=A0A7T0G2C2_9BACT|nr:MAG: UDP-N-acetylglucosamine 2-epimerase (hydrolyzing) [Candidatus Nitrohelix vancouverensis]